MMLAHCQPRHERIQVSEQKPAFQLRSPSVVALESTAYGEADQGHRHPDGANSSARQELRSATARHYAARPCDPVSERRGQRLAIAASSLSRLPASTKPPAQKSPPA